jgi:tRNA threonylcarbamoyladenosine biosynthesis protein TsaB
MKILAFESSAVSAAVALIEDKKLVAQSFQNCGLTHSRTLLPMAESLLAGCGVPLSAVDAFAVAAGPGSFTGLRIGVATVKGLAFPSDTPCVGVSTLEAMAYNLEGFSEEICCVMDARAGQVYNARFRWQHDHLYRLCEDRAIRLDELAAEIASTPQIVIGDGTDLCYTKLNSICPGLHLAPPHLRFASAYGVAMAALPVLQQGQGINAQTLDARYLRPPYVTQKH